MITRHILEILAEQGAVEEGYYRAIGRHYLGTLIGDALHLARYTITFYIVSYVHPACHQIDAIEEVLQYALHGKAQTRGQACAYDGNATLGDLQDGQGYQDICTPAQDGYHVAGKGDIEILSRGNNGAARVGIESAYRIIEETEHKPQSGHQTDTIEREANQIAGLDEICHEDFFADAGHLKYFGSPIETQQDAGDTQDGQQGTIQEII